MRQHADAQQTESNLRRLRWHLGSVVVLVALLVAGLVAAAATEVNTGDAGLIAVLITVSAVTLMRLALATVAGRLRPIVPLAFLLGLLASIALFGSFLRYAEGGDETGSAGLLFPISIAHLVSVIAYGVVSGVVYRQRGRNTASVGLLVGIAYVGILLTFSHVLFV